MWRGAQAEDASEEIINDVAYVPDASGFRIELPDGVSSQVRFRRDSGRKSGFVAEWRIANRSFPTPPNHALAKCVPRVSQYFSKSHTPIDPSPEALAMHQSFQGAFNVCCRRFK